jgi:hypothetical protein
MQCPFLIVPAPLGVVIHISLGCGRFRGNVRLAGVLQQFGCRCVPQFGTLSKILAVLRL